MSDKLYTKAELVRKYAGIFIDTYPRYNYTERKWYFEFRGASKKIRENYNPPELLLDE